MNYRKLNHWPRNCPKCGTTFQSVQKLGRCPECEHLFKTDSAGIPNNIEIEHPTLGIIESFVAKKDKEIGAREWGIKRFERNGDPERCVSIVGDCFGPQARSFDDILKIVECCDEIEQLVLDKINGNPKAFPFASKISYIDYFGIRFFDRDDSTRYSAHMSYTLSRVHPFMSCHPFTEYLGCNDFELVFEMRGLKFVGLFPGTEEHSNLRLARSILQWFFGCLVPLILVGVALVFGIIKLDAWFGK